MSFHRNKSLRNGGSALSRNGGGNDDTLKLSASPEKSFPEIPLIVSSDRDVEIFVGDAESVAPDRYPASTAGPLIIPKRKRRKASSQARERERSVRSARG